MIENILAIINPISGYARARQLPMKLQRRLRDEGFSTRIHITQGPNDATDYVHRHGGDDGAVESALRHFAGVLVHGPSERARELALEALAIAKSDFSKAVEKGDPGSTANAGFVPRGVLEPSVEYALFTLEKGTVHAEPIETPRGFWIVRRIQ